jgi:hypothetical protein
MLFNKQKVEKLLLVYEWDIISILERPKLFEKISVLVILIVVFVIQLFIKASERN